MNKVAKRRMKTVGGSVTTEQMAVQEGVFTGDAFSNPLFRLGLGSQSPLEATAYPLTRMTQNYALLNSLYRDNWVVQNVIDIVPDDMLKRWFTLSGVQGMEKKEQMNQQARRSQLKARISQGLKWGRLYGGAVGIILIEGQENQMDRPLDTSLIYPGSFHGMYILDRWSGVSPSTTLVTDPADPDFGLPEYYDISNGSGNVYARVHHSRVIRFLGRMLPYTEQMAESYWGESEIEALYSDIVKHDNVAHNMAALTFRANVDTMEVRNLDQLFSLGSAEQQRRFWNTMQAQSVCKSNFGMQLVNEGTKLTNTQYTFAGLKDIYDSMCLDLAGASRIPVTKLFGRAPAGMNATGESDLQNYYDYIDNLRESVLRPILYRLLPVMAMSAWGIAPEGLDIAFPPLWMPTAKEAAEIAKAKTETVIAAFQAGLLDQGAAQSELKKLSGETGLFDAISDEEIAKNQGRTFQDVTALRDPLMGLGFEEEDSPFELAAQDAAVMDYPGQPREKNGRFAAGKKLTGEQNHGKLDAQESVSATGENHFTQGFTKYNLNRHFGGGGDSDHSDQYPGYTKEQYAQRALDLVQSRADGKRILGYKTPEGEVVRYDTATNDYAKGFPNGGIKTMFKPDAGVVYFRKRMRVEHGTDQD